ncbi:hypothetical protein DRH29_02800 [candidate division Kazan bacterium]|uniref:Uncharacterized protein n=1 Tax=candidate division Kazan bacterium TaxID=2202143 RepID=A0A420ZCK8_UNCK3|nr:MAG: hypothetical protein DRH29_02800 [candidate division Kazan bacterium]
MARRNTEKKGVEKKAPVAKNKNENKVKAIKVAFRQLSKLAEAPKALLALAAKASAITQSGVFKDTPRKVFTAHKGSEIEGKGRYWALSHDKAGTSLFLEASEGRFQELFTATGPGCVGRVFEHATNHANGRPVPRLEVRRKTGWEEKAMDD